MGVNDCKLCLAMCTKYEDRPTAALVGALTVRCNTCGHARVEAEALHEILERPVPRKFVWGYLRAHGTEKKPVHVTIETVADIERAGLSMQSVPERLKHLLLNIEPRTQYPGCIAEFRLDWDFPLAYADNESELHYYFDELRAQAFIEYNGSGPPAHAKLLSKGWEQIEELRRSGGNGKKSFVAMSFDPAYDQTWEIIARVIGYCDFEPYRIDRAEHAELIPMRMLSDLRASRFVVADITGHRGGVYFEAGYGMALGRTVIWMCREDDFANAHFDVRQYNHILYSDGADLERKLAARITALIV